jgi:DnaD/phage-associated family protein
MPKFRKLWTKTLDSFDFNEMPDDFCRVVWLLLPLILDSEGRGIDLPAWVCSRMFPLRRVDEADVVRAFEFFESRGMIVRYKVESRSYFYCVNWTTYQSGTEKEAASVLPPTPDQLQTNSRPGQAQVVVAASASASESESVNASESKKRPEIFSIYEHEIGALTSTIADELQSAGDDYPEDWIVDALKESARQNKRSWAYAKAILKRRKADGGRVEKKPATRVLTDPYGNPVEVEG